MVAGASADDGAAFESFRAAFADAQAGDETNDPSLNMLLGLAEPSFAAVIQNLSVPHWFDEQIVAEARAPGETLEPAAIIEELADLPFVRLHPRGYAYHDVIRSSLRDSVMRRDVSRLRRLCCGIGSVLDGRPEEDLPEEIAWESVYLLLGCDEASGFERLDILFRAAHSTRRFTVCATLAALAEEQRPILSEQGKARVDFYCGLEAFDQQRWEEAAGLFDQVVVQELPVDLANRVRLYRGRTLEARELWSEAKQAYGEHLTRARGVIGNRGLQARLHQGLARVALGQGDLREAEAEAKRSLEINRVAGDRFGQAMNLQVLGQVYTRLGGLERASEALVGSLSALDELGREFDKSRIYLSLAQIYADFDHVALAERYYRRALDTRTAAGDNYGVAFIYARLGALHAQLGESQTALRYFQAGLSGFQLVRDRLNAARLLRNMSMTCERVGDLDRATEHMRQAANELPPDATLKPAYEMHVRRLETKARQSNLSYRGWLLILVVAVEVVLYLILLYVQLRPSLPL